jgi:hypothetical protein
LSGADAGERETTMTNAKRFTVQPSFRNGVRSGACVKDTMPPSGSDGHLYDAPGVELATEDCARRNAAFDAESRAMAKLGKVWMQSPHGSRPYYWGTPEKARATCCVD